MGRRFRGGFRGTANVDVEVQVGDVLDDMDDDDLKQYCEERFGNADRVKVSAAEIVAEQVEAYLIAGQVDEALLFVQRWARPKFKTLDACLLAFGGRPS